MGIDRRQFLRNSALLTLGSPVAAASFSGGHPLSDNRPGEAPLQFPSRLDLKGDLGRRMELTERRLQHHPYDLDFVVQDVARKAGLLRRFEEYEGDVSGRTLGAWSYAARLAGRRPEPLDRIAGQILQHQSPEGWFGLDQRGKDFDTWGRQNFGHGRLLVGLTEYYRLSGNSEVLEAARKLGDYFVRTIPHWTTDFEEHPWKKTGKIDWGNDTSNRLHFIKTHQTSVLEGLMHLNRISPRTDYVEAGRHIVDLFPAFGQFHSHSYLNTMVGMAMLYQHTGDPLLLDRLIRDYWQHITPRSVPADGGINEWFPVDHRTEGCSITDWVRLNLKLWEITREAVYVEEAERTWLNGLNFHQTGNGAFGHATVTPTGYRSEYVEAWWCCLMHGLYAYAEVAEHIAAAREADVWFNLYTPATFQLDGRMVRMETKYPAEGNVRIDPGLSGQRRVHLRLPAWADSFEVQVNGQPAGGGLEKGYFVVDRTWQPGDTLTFHFPIRLRIEDQRGNILTDMQKPGDDLYTGHLFHGPLLLGADTRHNDLMPVSVSVRPGTDYTAAIEPSPFSVEKARYRLPAHFEPANSGMVTLVPIGEQTGYTEWSDTMPHFLRNSEEPIERAAVQTRFQILILKA